MIRSNTFVVKFNNPSAVKDIAEGCSTLWNVINYRRRQSFFSGIIDWSYKGEYDDFKTWVGSATAQQIIRKNTDSWKSFFALLKKKDKLPDDFIIRPPGYWKDRKTGELKLRVIIRNDCYSITNSKLKLPKKVKGRIRGKPHWNGKEGTLELSFDRVRDKWYAHQSVEVLPRHQPIGHKTAYVDLGVKCIITGLIEGDRKPIVYSGVPLLTDWWYWNKEIRKYQSVLKTVN
ncbi:unnamed protein product, partial [marine sediment metagenome]